jgi:poly-gamma-glutamate capsule biosynthesis protein CapA/YwtB (metallophosphatase superfamily)
VKYLLLVALLLSAFATACGDDDLTPSPTDELETGETVEAMRTSPGATATPPIGAEAQVTRLIDGDTIEIDLAAAGSPQPSVEPTAIPTPAFLTVDQVPPITLAAVFEPQPPLKLDPSRIRTLIATGDVIPARRVDIQIRAQNDFLYPIAQTADVLRQADITLINLEAPLIADCPPQSEGFVFCGQAGFIEALVHAGVDIAGLENNHIGNYGMDGVQATKDLLRENNIDFADRATLAVREVRGMKFGFLAFNGVGEVFDRPAIMAAIAGARAQVDILVTAFHWGAEYVSVPQAAPGIAPDEPVEIGHLAVDAGADLVIGNHPHWVQAVEVYNGKLITYAHGNFIFDQMWSVSTSQGVVGRYTFYDDRLAQVEFIPVFIENEAQPRLLPAEEAKAVLTTMQQASERLAVQLGAGP